MILCTDLSDATIGSIVAIEVGNPCDRRYGPKEQNYAVVIGDYQLFPNKPAPERRHLLIATRTPEGETLVGLGGEAIDSTTMQGMEYSYTTDVRPLNSAVGQRLLREERVTLSVAEIEELAARLPVGDWLVETRSHIGRR